MSELERLFDLYSSDLARLDHQSSGVFQCPLCHAVVHRVPDLRYVVAEEHVVPEALGGRLTTLTCRQCNNSHGSSLEAHLVQQVRLEARKIGIPARVRVGAAEYGAEFHIPQDPEGVRDIIGVAKQSDPQAFRLSEEALRTGERTIHLTLHFRYNARRSRVALLRAAYLLMFRTFGYSYVFDPSASALRDQILNPRESGPFLDAITWRLRGVVPGGTFAAVCMEPVPCFLAIARLQRDPPHQAVVSLPLPGEATLRRGGGPTDVRVRRVRLKRDRFVSFSEAGRLLLCGALS